MDSIISNLLQLSRIESGKIIPATEKVSIQKMFFRLKEEFKAINKDMTIQFEEKPLREIYTDSELLHQVFLQIYCYLLKYSFSLHLLYLAFL